MLSFGSFIHISYTNVHQPEQRKPRGTLFDVIFSFFTVSAALTINLSPSHKNLDFSSPPPSPFIGLLSQVRPPDKKKDPVPCQLYVLCSPADDIDDIFSCSHAPAFFL